MDVSSVARPFAALGTLSPRKVQITGGFWKAQQASNHAITLRDGYEKLERAGNFANLRRAAGMTDEPYQGPVFMDEDVYKWLEAVAHEIGINPDPELVEMVDSTIALLARVQQEDGYLDSYFQVVAPGQKWQDLDHGHEMYCAGHLIQAAIAHHRATGSAALLNIAIRFADHIDSVFGPGKRDGTCGHPEIEMTLVELYRETAEERYLKLAQVLVDRRGRNQMVGLGPYGPEYHQDRVPVREAQQVEGHAVRQLYLATGVTDIYLETGEQALFDAMRRLWHDATAYKMFITGGFGSRFEGESFGDPYELPSDRCYCETCAAIASLMWNWRMLIATGEARFAGELERVLYNGFLSGRSLDGTHYFYMNPLESRGDYVRPDWHRVACCPPNIMRLIATLGHYVATVTDGGVQVHQYMHSRVQAGTESTPRTLQLETGYPWNGQVRLTVLEAGAEAWELSLRIPAWAADSEVRLAVNGKAIEAIQPGSYASINREWQAGDVIELELPVQPRWIVPNPRIDAIRSSVAITRGPLVYCLEDTDQPEGANLLDVRAVVSAPPEDSPREELLGGIVAVQLDGRVEDASNWENRLYRPLDNEDGSGRPVKLTAIPYYAWSNRGNAAMRVWIPRAGR